MFDSVLCAFALDACEYLFLSVLPIAKYVNSDFEPPSYLSGVEQMDNDPFRVANWDKFFILSVESYFIYLSPPIPY